MYQLTKLENNLESVLKNFNITEKIDIKLTRNESFDLQINNLVKLKDNPNLIEIIDNFQRELDSEPFIKKYEISEKNFINIEINLNEFLKTVENVRNFIKVSSPKKIIFDYGGPNIGKPLHVGHLRSLNIGRSLYNVNKLAGNTVLSDIHMGDWGMPIAQIIQYGIEKKIDFENITIQELEEIYPIASDLYSKNNDFTQLAQNINKNLNNNQKDLINKWKKIKGTSLRSLESTLDQLNHKFDLWRGESDVNDLIPDMIEDLKSKNKISLDDGAYVSSLKTDPKILITKSDGSYLYLTTDLATVLDRLDNFEFDKTLYIVDKRQKLHFEQLFLSLEYFDFPTKEYEHIPFGTVNDADGNPFKTREGGTKKLTDLYDETYKYIKAINNELDEVSLGLLSNTVLTYSDLITNRNTDYKFDLEKFTNVNGKTGVYIQYANVRAKKLINDSSLEVSDFSILSEELDNNDKSLLRSLIKFEFYFEQTIKNNEPHHLADYLYEISQKFNGMYQGINILENENTVLKENKLKITDLFLQYSNLLMECLGILPVKKM
ncbi:MAG: arginine--tRNA ligase [Gammaproteobacteria bacterium]|nr:MAG: arginine--tRNA ligase [Gammaproteobacteria bacterium]